MMGTGRGTDLEGYWRCKQRHYKEASGVAGLAIWVYSVSVCTLRFISGHAFLPVPAGAPHFTTTRT